MLDKRVEALEADMKAVRTSLQGIEKTLVEINAQMVKSSDFLKLATDVAELKGQVAKTGDLTSIRSDIAELKGKVSQIPTIWQLVGLLIGAGGLFFTILRFGLK